MKLRPLLALAVVLAGCLTPFASQASTTRSIDIWTSEFSPRGLAASAGDTIVWTRQRGSHTVTAYSGATFDVPLPDSPSTAPFTLSYSGGTILYYCKVHSKLEASNRCSGPMCGKISDSQPPVAVPAFTSPAAGATISSHAFDVQGSAGSGVAQVRLKEGQTTLGLPTVRSGAWSQYVELPNGTHTLTAIGLDQDGFESAASAPLTFTVSSATDTKPPTIVFSSPSGLAAFGQIVISGDAIDEDTNVSAITIRVTDSFGALWSVSDDDGMAWACTSCGTERRIHFAARALVPSGFYSVVVSATDSATQPHSTTDGRSIFIV